MSARHWTALVCLLLACSDPGAGTGLDASREDARPPPVLAAHTPAARSLRPHRASSSTTLPQETPRSPEQLAMAACRASSGWACPSIRQPMASPMTVGQSPSWTVPTWYVDPANSVGCAADVNSCTAASCIGTGIGPCRTINEIVRRWGTYEPVLTQSTTITVLSSETLGQEHVVLRPVVVNGSTFGLVGVPTTVASGAALGVVTPKNRSTPQLLTAPLGPPAAIGQLVVNTTHPSHAWVQNLVAGTATFTQPLAPLTIADASNSPASMPAEVDTWATADHVDLRTLPAVNLDVFAPSGGGSTAGHTGGAAWVQYLHVLDASGTPGNSAIALGAPDTIVWVVDCAVDASANLTAFNPSGIYGKFAVNDYFADVQIASGSMIGGCNSLYVVAVGTLGTIDGDAITTSMFAFDAWPAIAGLAYSAGASAVDRGQLEQEGDWYAQSIVWGPGSVAVTNGACYQNDSGTTWAASLLLPTLTLEGAATGTSYNAGVWTDGRTLTAANLDVYSALQDVNTAARYTLAR